MGSKQAQIDLKTREIHDRIPKFPRNQSNLLENIAGLVSFRPDLGARAEYSVKSKFYFGKFRDFEGSQNLKKFRNLERRGLGRNS